MEMMITHLMTIAGEWLQSIGGGSPIGNFLPKEGTWILCDCALVFISRGEIQYHMWVIVCYQGLNEICTFFPVNYFQMVGENKRLLLSKNDSIISHNAVVVIFIYIR